MRQRHQQIVERPVALQDVHPGIDADQERGPERQHDEQHEHRLPAPRRARDAVGDRIADGEQQQRRERGDLQALDIGQEIERIGAEQPVIVERQRGEKRLEALPAGGEVEHRRIGRLRDRRLRQADLEHDQERHQKEREQPRIRNAHDQRRQEGLRAVASWCFHRCPHRVSTIAASARPAQPDLLVNADWRARRPPTLATAACTGEPSRMRSL